MENINKSNKIYKGNIEITKENYLEWEKKLLYTEEVSGYIDVSENATLTAPKLTEVSGYIDVRENATLTAPKLIKSGYINVRENATIEKQLWKIASKNKWYISEKSSEWLLSKNGNFEYRLNNVSFEKEWFNKIRKNELTAEEVFAIDNIEHRRIAYEFMDKAKMKKLKDYEVLDEVKDDGYGHEMKIVSFKVQNMQTPLIFLNCFCPSTSREYYLGTDKKTCNKAKMGSFGLDKNIKFIKEW